MNNQETKLLNEFISAICERIRVDPSAVSLRIIREEAERVLLPYIVLPDPWRPMIDEALAANPDLTQDGRELVESQLRKVPEEHIPMVRSTGLHKGYDRQSMIEFLEARKGESK